MILTDEELLSVVKHGLWTKVKDYDDEYTHYHVLDFTSELLLIYYGSIDWKHGETYYRPHIIYQSEKNKSWFFKEPEGEQI